LKPVLTSTHGVAILVNLSLTACLGECYQLRTATYAEDLLFI